MAFLDMDGNYYEGDLADLRDIEVPTRPTQYHSYNRKLKQWVLDEDKVMVLKKEILRRLDEELHSKTVILNLSDDEKKAINNLYQEKINKLSTTNDPVLLQELSLG